jgi:hypothetical protein
MERAPSPAAFDFDFEAYTLLKNSVSYQGIALAMP